MSPEPNKEYHLGLVARLPNGKPFGFIETIEGQELYFSVNHCTNRMVFHRLKIGDKVKFTIGSNKEGRVLIT